MSEDPAPFVPPERYPSPPKNMWYEVPKEPPRPPAERLRPIFPWEGHQPRASRTFIGEELIPPPVETASEPGERETSAYSRPTTETSGAESSTTEQKSEPATPTTPTIRGMPSDPWTSFTRTNAWDEVPEIERYVEGLQKHKRGKSQVFAGASGGSKAGEDGLEPAWGHRGLKLTDFPTEVERPSLPVTPAPIRRPKFWGGGGPGIGEDEGDELLPAAEGVPAQAEWVCVHGKRWSPADCLCELTNMLRHYKDPVAQLQKLAKQQSEALLRRLGGDEGETASELPTRALPFGSDGATSGETYVAHSRGGVVLSPRPVKGDTTSIVRSMGEREESATSQAAGSVSAGIPEPAYTGPGAAWEKDENIPIMETPALPSEEELDVLNT